MMQLSALSVSVCIDQDQAKLKKVMNFFQNEFQFSIQDDLELLTILNFKQQDLNRISSGKEIIMEQITKKNAQFLTK